MDRGILVDRLGLVPGGGFSIADIQMVQWGRDMVFEMVYRTAPRNAPPDPPVHINLIFQDCREIRYKVYAHIGMHEMGHVTAVADVAELLLGKSNHRREASILTNYFGVSVSYGTLRLEMGDHQITLDR